MKRVLSLAVLVWCGAAVTQTPDSGNYRYDQQPPAARCSDGDRPKACVNTINSPTSGNTALGARPLNVDTAPTCGDGICQVSRGESLSNCAVDCQGGSSPPGGRCVVYVAESPSQPASSDATGCDQGTYADQPDDASFWRWSCALSDVATQCSAPRGAGPSCRAAAGQFSSQPAADTASGCNSGAYSDLADTSTDWRWTCALGSASVVCTASRIDPPACVAHPGTHATQPASSDASGCATGAYADAPDSPEAWGWTCANAAGSQLCSALKPEPAQCRNYPDQYASQPATATASGCIAGAYQDASDTESNWRWTCQNAAGPQTCSAAKVPAPVCRNYPSQYAAQPGTDTSNACEIGEFADRGDTSADWRWRCANSSGETICDAEKAAGAPCGTATGVATATFPAAQQCQAGSTRTDQDTAGTDGDFNWTCTRFGTTRACKAPRQ